MHTDTIVTTLRDARDGRTVFESRDQFEASGKVQSLAHRTQLPLKGLGSGIYVLRVEATSTVANHSAHRELLLEVTDSAPRTP